MLPTVILPGYFESADLYLPLQQALTKIGTKATTVPLRKRDWLPTLGGRSMVPILRQLDRTVNAALIDNSSQQINLIGHSAGGWISRIYLGEIPYTIYGDVTASTVGLWNARAKIATLITLGTPQISCEKLTKKNLDFVNDNYPGAFYPEVSYICVAGKSIYGKKQFGHCLAYSSYQMICGAGNTWGDGITPVTAAHLAGATNITIEGVKHSPNTSGTWYGSLEVRSQWVGYLS
ncbi:esterase/lipase family protein [Chamaesiphon sp.]|uniref:esterase/lipase family protein n=1 Tax=Chamaesiphon sp. TaxID=2814140 RepID=UPI003593DB4B